MVREHRSRCADERDGEGALTFATLAAMPDPYIVFPGIGAVIVGGLIMWAVAVLYSRWQDSNARANSNKRCNVEGKSVDGWRRTCTLPGGHDGENVDQRARSAVVTWN